MYFMTFGCIYTFVQVWEWNIQLLVDSEGGVLRPRPIQRSGTGRKYRCIAAMNLSRYSSGEIIVGSFPWPPRIPDFFTMVSIFLSHVKVRK